MAQDDVDIQAWVAAFQASQREIAEGHAAFQRALAESHARFITAMEESQQKLVDVLSSHLEPAELQLILDELQGHSEGEMTEVGEVIEETEAVVVRRLRRRVAAAVRTEIVDRNSAPHRAWAITRDGMGIAELLAADLQAARCEARVVASWGEVKPEEGLIELSGVRQYKNADEAGALVVRIANRARKYGATRGTAPTVLVQDTFGRYGLDICDPFRAFLGGLRGVAAAMALTIDNVRCVDLDVGHRLPTEVAPLLEDEVLYGTGQSVGRPDDERITLSWVDAPLVTESDDGKGLVVVTTPVSERFVSSVLAYCAKHADEVVLVGKRDPGLSDALSRMGKVTTVANDDITALVGEIQVAVQGRRIKSILHANDRGWGPGELEPAYSQRIALLQVLLAATAAYGADQTAILVDENPGWAGLVFDEMLRRFAHAETQRQADDGITRAIVVGPGVSPRDIVQELTSKSRAPEVWLAMD